MFLFCVVLDLVLEANSCICVWFQITNTKITLNTNKLLQWKWKIQSLISSETEGLWKLFFSLSSQVVCFCHFWFVGGCEEDHLCYCQCHNAFLSLSLQIREIHSVPLDYFQGSLLYPLKSSCMLFVLPTNGTLPWSYQRIMCTDELIHGSFNILTLSRSRS